MPYRHHMEEHLNHLFMEAENRRELLMPSNRNEAAALELRLKKGDVVKPYKLQFARKTYWESLRPPLQTKHIIRTCSRAHPELTFSHTSAAIMHGLEVHWSVLKPLHIITGAQKRLRENPGLVQHRTSNLASLVKDGVSVTTIEQTVIDCAASLDLVYSLAIADSALHLGLTNKMRLETYLDSTPKRRGIRLAKRVIKLADPRPDNGGESYVRAVMLDEGLPTPDLQVPVENPDKPGHYYYVDFMFTRADGVKIAVELDGREKYENPEMTKGQSMSSVLREERRRESLLTSHAVQVVRFSFAEASNPAVLLRKLNYYGIAPKKVNERTRNRG